MVGAQRFLDEQRWGTPRRDIVARTWSEIQAAVDSSSTELELVTPILNQTPEDRIESARAELTESVAQDLLENIARRA